MTGTRGLADGGADPGFRRAQWEVLLATSFCYLFYYTGRQNFGWAIKGIREDLGLSNTQIGWISGIALACYGAGQIVSGHLGDRFGGRRMVALGAGLSCALNWLTSFGRDFGTLLAFWSLNNVAQSMGFAPASRLIANWWGPRERGRAFGIFNFAAGFSSVVTFAAAILVLTYLSWAWVFRLPVLLMPMAALVFFGLVRDRPEARELRSASEPRDGPGGEGPAVSMIARYRGVLANRRFVIASAGYGFTNWGRLALLVWAPPHFLGAGWKTDPAAAWVTLALPLGMALGALAAGYASDRIFGADHARLIALSLLAAAGMTSTLVFVPQGGRALGTVLLFLAGFFVFAPVSSFSALCPELLGRRATGAGTGLMNAVGYATAALGDLVIGVVMDATGFSGSVFGIAAGACLAGAGCSALIRLTPPTT